MTQADAEIKQYLRLLLQHSNECQDKGCPSDALLHEIFGMIRERIFSGPHVFAGHGGDPSAQPRDYREDVRTGAAVGKA